MASRPMRIAAAGFLVTLLSCLGFLRFSINSGQSLLVGSQSGSAKTYAQFTQTFGADPLVVLFTASNGQAFELDKNLQRLAAAEDDISEIPGVVSVMGPGTVLRDAHFSEQSEIGAISVEYPDFAANQFAQASYQKDGDAAKAQQIFNTAQQQTFDCLINATVVAEQAAETARDSYKAKPGDRVVVSRENAATAAAISALLHVQSPCSGDTTSLPALFAEFVTGSSGPQAQSQAATVLGDLVAAFGTCDPNIAHASGVTTNCQVFDEHLLLELHGTGADRCPPVNAKTGACPPRDVWAPILPKPPVSGDASYAVLLIRLTPSAAQNRDQVNRIKQQITDDFRTGIRSSDPYIKTLQAQSAKLKTKDPSRSAEYAARAKTYVDLKALSPTECGGLPKTQVANCVDRPVSMVITGAPPLSFAVVDSLRDSLFLILPFSLLLMALILASVFRVRGRFWPLLAAVMATLTTAGIALLVGASLNPAVLAAVPILVGLGVDYAVQLIARFDAEMAASDGGRDRVVANVVSSTGTATAIAALATIAALLVLALIAGIDAGPLVAVPLIADFALVVAGGTLLAWLAAIGVAFPIAVARYGETAPVTTTPPPAAAAWRARRILSWSSGIKPLLGITGLIALAGWVLLAAGKVPVETDLQTLLAGNVGEVQKLDQVAAATGANSEVDLYLRGDVGGVSDNGKAPSLPFGSPTVYWECQAADRMHQTYGSLVPYAFGPTDLLIGSSRTSSPCLKPTPSPSPSPASPSPHPTASATGVHRGAVRMTAYHREASASPTPAPPSGAPAPAASPPVAAAPSPTPTPVPQSQFVCDLRSMPAMSSLLVAPMVPVGGSVGPIKDPDSVIEPCPPSITGVTVPDHTPVKLTQARIAIAVSPAGAGDIAHLTDSLEKQAAGAPRTLTAAPTGLSVLAGKSYEIISGRGFFFNAVPLLILLGILLLIYSRRRRQAVLAVLPTALAAGWVPLVTRALGILPGKTGAVLGSFNPLSAVMGALVIALATEFGIVLLSRFYEELESDGDIEAAAGRALARTGRPIVVSAATLMAGFAALAVSALLPSGMPLLGSFGVSVVLDLALAVVAVFWVMLPVAMAWERRAQQHVAVMAEVAAAAPAEPRRRAISAIQAQSATQRQAKTRATARTSSLSGAPPAPLAKKSPSKAAPRPERPAEGGTTAPAPKKRASKPATSKPTTSKAAPKRVSGSRPTSKRTTKGATPSPSEPAPSDSEDRPKPARKRSAKKPAEPGDAGAD